MNELVMERAWDHKPNVEISPNCPRCGSSNTKFCYYNNYSLTQPRYFCKGCRRYWTKGGSLRNVPIGGGCRRNRRGKSVRLSTDGVSSKSLPYMDDEINKVAANFIESPSSSSLMQQQGGSHIDLALVYANFLNQPPETKPAGDFELPDLPDVDPSSMELNSCMVTKNLETRVQLPGENVNNRLGGTLSFSDLSSAASQTHLRDGSDQLYYNLFDSVHKNIHHHHHHHHHQDGVIQCNQVLPAPLPSEDVLWLNSQMMINNQSLQSAPSATQEPMLGPDLHQAQDPNNNLLFGNWTPFDFSSDDSFSKT